jgi:hypothetical protein
MVFMVVLLLNRWLSVSRDIVGGAILAPQHQRADRAGVPAGFVLRVRTAAGSGGLARGHVNLSQNVTPDRANVLGASDENVFRFVAK